MTLAWCRSTGRAPKATLTAFEFWSTTAQTLMHATDKAAHHSWSLRSAAHRPKSLKENNESARWGRADAVAFLVRIGADVRIFDRHDDSALHWAYFASSKKMHAHCGK